MPRKLLTPRRKLLTRRRLVWGAAAAIAAPAIIRARSAGAIGSTGVGSDGLEIYNPFTQPTTAGKLFAWGYNKQGECGQGTHGSYPSPQYAYYSPIQVGALTTWVRVFTGYDEIFGQHSDGTVQAWGRNALGQLGVSDRVGRSSPTNVGSLTTWGRITEGSDAGAAGLQSGTAFNWGQIFFYPNGFAYQPSPVQIGPNTDWQDMVAQEQFFMGIRGGRLFGWGNNDHYQLGLGYKSPLSPNISSPTQVGTSLRWHRINKGWGPVTSALQNDRRLFMWGLPSTFQMGTGEPGYVRYVPVPTLVCADKAWRQVTTGYGHVVGIDVYGHLWTWGANGSGQLGLGDTVLRSSPTQVGSLTWAMVATGNDHVVGITTDGKLWAWGRNNYGKLGNGQHGIPNTNPGLNSKSSPVQIGTETTWSWVAATKYNSFGIRT